MGVLQEALPSQNVAPDHHQENVPVGTNIGDSELCARILDSDSAIRSVVVVEGSKVSGFAASAKASDILGRSSDFREKIGMWVRLVTEIARQGEPVFGNLGSALFVHGRMKVATFPISANRSIGLSFEKSADWNYLIQKIVSKFGPNL